MVTQFWKEELPFYLKRLTKKYYIIRRPALGAGFFSNYFWVLGHVVFAKKLGYIPVVDMENYKTLYSEEEPVDGVSNAWNYYFRDVDQVGLKEAYDSGRFVLGNEKYLTRYAEKYCDPNYRYPTDKMIDYYAPYIRKFLRIREDLLQKFESEWTEDMHGMDRSIGVHIRGTDMKNDLGHPLPADVTSYVEEIQKLLKEDERITHIYLATDEINILQKVQELLADEKVQICFQDAFRVEDTGEKRKVGIHETKLEKERTHHHYLMGEEVLRDAWFLSKCDYLVCGHSNITNVVIMWNNHKYRKIVLCERREGNV